MIQSEGGTEITLARHKQVEDRKKLWERGKLGGITKE